MKRPWWRGPRSSLRRCAESSQQREWCGIRAQRAGAERQRRESRTARRVFLGFGQAATAGTGIGLANIRERLQLLYGNKGSVTIGENQPSGTTVTITVPYQAQAREGDGA